MKTANQKVLSARRRAGRALRKIIDDARKYIDAEDELERELRAERGGEDYAGGRKGDG